MYQSLRKLFLTLTILGMSAFAMAADADSQDKPADKAVYTKLKATLEKRLPQIGKITEIRSTQIPGILEIRTNDSDIYYSDAKGDYLFYGQLLDTAGRRNLTKEREEKLTAINFAALPLKDSFTIVRGNGEKHIAVFEDPNCGYCKHFERDLQKLDNITVHLFLYPILGGDSEEKSRNLWCSADKSKAWQDWMLREQPINSAAACDTTALARNVEFGKKYKISGTPTIFLQNGSRIPGAVDSGELERRMSAASKS